MTGKRLKKLLMARGYQRNTADYLVRITMWFDENTDIPATNKEKEHKIGPAKGGKETR